MVAGRPIGSIVRERIAAILSELGKAYGYKVHKEYIKRFHGTTRENVYYHLKKGVMLGIFKEVEIKTEKGHYSWGESVEKKYYALGRK
ncbi:hypothetical protein HY486_00155 [Candidatus Woesearchaeota archaeon]|nr:hypothetical protein [Candidatus Woesearchaeota archaeon]